MTTTGTNITQMLRAMRPGDSLTFAAEKEASLRVLAGRLGFTLDRHYKVARVREPRSVVVTLKA